MDDKIDYRQILKAEYLELKLNNGEHIIRQNLTGFYRGTTNSLIKFLDNLYDFESL